MQIRQTIRISAWSLAIDYIARRRQDGKTTREANRCLKRYLARNLYRLLEHPPMTA